MGNRESPQQQVMMRVKVELLASTEFLAIYRKSGAEYQVYAREVGQNGQVQRSAIEILTLRY